MINIKLRKWLLFSIGISIMSLGISLTVSAKVWGVSPWDTFHLGLVNSLGLNFGQIVQLVGAAAIVLGAFLSVMPRLGTILNMIFVGLLANFFLNLYPPDIFEEYSIISFLVFVIGIVFSGIGTGLYITADVGIGPRDSIMIGLNRKFGIRIAHARTFLEITVVILGFFLAGPIGIGTVLFSLTIGYVVEKTIKIYKAFNSAKAQTDEG